MDRFSTLNSSIWLPSFIDMAWYGYLYPPYTLIPHYTIIDFIEMTLVEIIFLYKNKKVLKLFMMCLDLQWHIDYEHKYH